MATDVFSEWPPAHYRTLAEDEEMEIPDTSGMKIQSCGLIVKGEITPPCDCGGWHSERNCPNAIVEWAGWQA